MSAFALLIPPADFSIHLQRLTERSSTTCASTTPLYLPRRPTRLLTVWVVSLSTTDVSTRRVSPG
ncbi:unnamed protein product [Laminaria digitata]